MTLSNDQPCVAECLDCPWSRAFNDVLEADTAGGEHAAEKNHLTEVVLEAER